MTLPIFMKDVRKQLNLSQEQLAKALNVSYSTINRWENRKTVPSKLAQRMLFSFCQDNFIHIPTELWKDR